MKQTVWLMVLLLWGLAVRADKYTDYVEIYSPVAVEEMERGGVPASITLAQGLLESGAGLSLLATEGNNHFGIKCHRDWQGATMYMDDDETGECFRVYGDARESFRDHTAFLQRKRYRPLFELSGDDYRGWAQGLSRLGYATDPNYAPKLIAIIEKYSLWEYDLGSGDRGERMSEFIARELGSRHALCRTGEGRPFVVALPGDSYASVSRELGMTEEGLRRANGDEEIQDWKEIYLR